MKLVKLAIALAVGAGGAASVVAMTSTRPEVVANSSAVAHAPRPTASASAGVDGTNPVTMSSATAPPSPPGVRADELPPASATASASPAAATAARQAPHDERDALAVEAALLEAARQCIARGDDCADSRLAEHDRRFGARAALRDEALMLGIETAKARGDEVALRTRARALLSERPNSPYARRVRALSTR